MTKSKADLGHKFRPCGHSCILGAPTGMSTNGACHCFMASGNWDTDRDEFRRARRIIQLLQKIIRDLE